MMTQLFNMVQPLAFSLVEMGSSLLYTMILAAILFGALVLLAENRSKEKIETYAVTAGIMGVLFWLLSLVGWFLLGAFVWISALVLWTSYKLLDFSLLRSVGVLVAVLLGWMLLNYLTIIALLI